MGPLQREPAAFAKIIAERLSKPQESQAQLSWLREDRARASHFRDVDGCEYVDSFLASGASATSCREQRPARLAPPTRRALTAPVRGALPRAVSRAPRQG